MRALRLAAALVALAAPAHADPAANKALVLRLYADVFNGHDLGHIDQLLAPGYIQHNPGVPTGRDGFTKAFTAYFKSDPTLKVSVKRVAAEGDLVFVHSHWTDADDARGQAVVDIFRVADSRIAEHWDVGKDIPKSVADPEALF